jgi:hypothetical protein
MAITDWSKSKIRPGLVYLGPGAHKSQAREGAGSLTSRSGTVEVPVSFSTGGVASAHLLL